MDVQVFTAAGMKSLLISSDARTQDASRASPASRFGVQLEDSSASAEPLALKPSAAPRCSLLTPPIPPTSAGFPRCQFYGSTARPARRAPDPHLRRQYQDAPATSSPNALRLQLSKEFARQLPPARKSPVTEQTIYAVAPQAFLNGALLLRRRRLRRPSSSPWPAAAKAPASRTDPPRAPADSSSPTPSKFDARLQRRNPSGRNAGYFSGSDSTKLTNSGWLRMPSKSRSAPAWI